MLTQRFGLMKYIPVFHPSGVALRSKSVPDGFVTKDITLMYCRVGFAHRDRNGGQSPLLDLLCGFKDQVRIRPSGEKYGLDQLSIFVFFKAYK